MGGLVVKPRSRIFHGHEWVYQSEVKKAFGEPQPGDVISLKDYRDRSLGTAIYNPASQIVARRISRRKQDLTADFFRRRLERAWNHRLEVIDPEATLARCVWSESDGLPGVILDRYGTSLVLQTLTLAMDQRLPLLVEAIEEVFQPEVLVLRNDSSGRQAEGLPKEVKVLRGEAQTIRHEVAPQVSFVIDVEEGQKTGIYLDQLENYGRVAKWAEGKRVLDCFCNQGGFALHAAAAGAKETLGVDISESAIQQAEENAQVGGLANVRFEEANVFDFLKAQEGQGKRYDLIILDPPSFTRSRKALSQALRGYKEIHLRALKMLEPGGLLATFCCSHHVDPDVFGNMLRDAAVDAKRTLREREHYTQRADHPVLVGIPETRYLHGLMVEVISSW
ncbi:MAG: class I SAM-dependent rRNA methyltransferase [Verrucomicrobiota bacterium]